MSLPITIIYSSLGPGGDRLGINKGRGNHWPCLRHDLGIGGGEKEEATSFELLVTLLLGCSVGPWSDLDSEPLARGGAKYGSKPFI